MGPATYSAPSGLGRVAYERPFPGLQASVRTTLREILERLD